MGERHTWTCDALFCNVARVGVSLYVPQGWYKVTVRVGSEHTSKHACSRACVQRILRDVADAIIMNDTEAETGAPVRVLHSTGRPYR